MKKVRKRIYGGKEKFKAEKVFSFNERKEYIIYRYVCGQKIGWSEWKKIQGKYEFITYDEWHNYVVNKYSSCTVKQLIEFSKYLNTRIRRESVMTQFCENGVYSSLVSTIIGAYMGYMVNTKIDNIVGFIVGAILVLISLAYAIKSILTDVYNYRSRYNMLQDYKDEIDNLIKEA